MPDSDSLKPNDPGRTKYVPPKAVRVSETRFARPALSSRAKRLGCEYDVRRSRSDKEHPSLVQ